MGKAGTAVLAFPPIPEVPEPQTIASHYRFLYPDMCQDGRIVLAALPNVLGVAVWGRLFAKHPVANYGHRKTAPVPVLTRVVMSASNETITLADPVETMGGFQFAHSRNPAGDVDRLLLNMWVEIAGAKGRGYKPAPPGTPLVTMGCVHFEHVFTRPFAPRDQRRVTSFEHDGMPAVPTDRVDWRPAADLLELPVGATWLDEELIPETSPTVFGLHHTDSNSHVNSMIYARLFEDAALRRLAAHGVSCVLLARHVEATYRKPCFAGDIVRIAARAFEITREDNTKLWGVVGAFVDSEELPRQHCYVRIVFAE